MWPNVSGRHCLQVVRTYPALESLGGGRNYPSTGSAVLLPLNAKERFRRAEVLVCGGAPNGAVKQAAKKVFVPALNTCGRLTVTDPAPVWRIETMPNSWVLNDMVLLPTQEVLLINGAQSGVAGWNMAENPVLNPVLYRPNGALGSRFTVSCWSLIGIPLRTWTQLELDRNSFLQLFS